jgi:hypothetical protein
VYIIVDNSFEWNESEGDALATATAGLALAVKTADCFPILIADPVTRAIAAVHAGWRGTLARIVCGTIQAMKERFGCGPSDLRVAIGPGIRRCCFEVGAEVAALFEKEFQDANLVVPAPARPGKYFLDLSRALDVQLELAGVRMENRHDLGACTCCRTDTFFSHRAEGLAAGRMMAVIGLRI